MSALGLVLAGEARRQRGFEFAASLRATHLVTSIARLGTSLSCRAPPVYSLLAGAGLAAIALLTARQKVELQRDSQQQQKRAASSHAVQFAGRKYCITYDALGGPCGRGSVLVAPRGSEVPTSEDFAEFLDSVAEFGSGKRCALKGFVVTFDSTHIVWPSMLSIPHIVAVLRERQPPECLRPSFTRTRVGSA
eukprot:TRINITY_DN23596_c0_g2_i2.p1 TRINITY_DN23596_c0_g2~~TRINITY_DN23596_c0_g2_i2.p1  ORF type:complete len:192 (+),score=26.99 TRINITY_DN23596_c0_g2_i2:65-640(+)